MIKEIVIKVARGFLAEDYNSGGYPYTTTLTHAKGFETTTDAWGWLGTCKSNYPEARLIYRVITTEEI